jgi:DUF4097 and DUF4098 domain-containing protein YvlB
MKIIKNIGKILKLKRKSLATFSFCLILFAGSAVSGFAQGTPAPTPKPWPMPKATPVKPKTHTPAPPAIGTPAPLPTPDAKDKRKIRNASEGPAEKTIAVDPKVIISLCVSSGTLKVNGWDRDEIRAFVDGGSSLGFRVLQYSKQNKKAAAIQIMGFDPKEHKELDLDECLDGDSIELDVPVDAVVNVKSKGSEISVDSISKVRIDNVSGSISLRDIKNGVDATTFEGDITAERTNGPVSLFASTGRVVVFESTPNEIGDPFRAKSRSGAISLQNVEHTDLEVSSATGSLRFTGAMEAGGQYKFNTTSGSIVLVLPMDTSCKVTATYGGSFETQIPFKDIYNDKGPNGIHKILALIGSGECAVTVTTYNGSILIKPNKK